jgi:hypothetical protein
MAELLLFHHVHRLTSGVRAFAERLRAAGHTVRSRSTGWTPTSSSSMRVMSSRPGSRRVHPGGRAVPLSRQQAPVRRQQPALIRRSSRRTAHRTGARVPRRHQVAARHCRRGSIRGWAPAAGLAHRRRSVTKFDAGSDGASAATLVPVGNVRVHALLTNLTGDGLLLGDLVGVKPHALHWSRLGVDDRALLVQHDLVFVL